MRSRAVRRLQEPARRVPEALMLSTLCAPHLLGPPRLQKPTYVEPIEAGTSPRFIDALKPKPEKFVATPGAASPFLLCRRHSTSIVTRRARRQYPKTSKPSGGELGTDDSRGLQGKRDRILDRRSKSTTHCKNRKSFSTWTSLVWVKWSTDRGTKTMAGRILQNANCGTRI